MAARTVKGPDPTPTEAEARQARAVAEALTRAESARGKVQLRVEKKTVDVPDRAVPLIAELMDKLGAGESVEVRTVHDTLSTTEVAEILNVSRPYVVKLLDQGLIPFEATEGNHRRVKRADLLAFKRQKDAERRQLADELAAEGQRLNREYRLEP